MFLTLKYFYQINDLNGAPYFTAAMVSLHFVIIEGSRFLYKFIDCWMLKSM